MKQKKWLILNNQKSLIDESWPDYLLKTDSYLLYKKPIITGHKKCRVCKDWVYFITNMKHLRMFHIQGSYIGLAAAYTPEIYSVFSKSITKQFWNCQNRYFDYKKLKEYQPFIAEKYPKVDFILKNKDIIDVMTNNPRKFAIMDLDFMWILDNKRIEQVSKAIYKAATKRSTAIIWHSANRKETEGDFNTNNIYRPNLIRHLSNYFNILLHDSINYYEGYPMRAEIFTLERKYG